ncbi:hypothetical protein G6045_11850 [Streptomyces sp. YC504]|uniref:Uncharacterized protein n=1 Tax=Streptomyces mesophilus TaxID=1775132 RepID=A0A6G4XG18_9ACTN|nr:hypothetical protein [Streptomyces mesophilus]NGO76348.1 hypothetical protein [Streptomyces mesophilus]
MNQLRTAVIGALLALSTLSLGAPAAFAAPAPGPANTCAKQKGEDKMCGGFAGFSCPEGKTCVDDPRDECVPANGGADCGGLCATPQEIENGYIETAPGKYIYLRDNPNLVSTDVSLKVGLL